MAAVWAVLGAAFVNVLIFLDVPWNYPVAAAIGITGYVALSCTDLWEPGVRLPPATRLNVYRREYAGEEPPLDVSELWMPRRE